MYMVEDKDHCEQKTPGDHTISDAISTSTEKNNAKLSLKPSCQLEQIKSQCINGVQKFR